MGIFPKHEALDYLLTAVGESIGILSPVTTRGLRTRFPYQLFRFFICPSELSSPAIMQIGYSQVGLSIG